ncbi:MAG: hypothetical protein LBP67_01645 [Bacteroidales bacterium]|nr:hypothetical protein [Bacteroidales bacterium]
MKTFFVLLIAMLAVSFMACDSNKDSINERLISEKSKGPIKIQYNADSINCVSISGHCKATIIINFDDDNLLLPDGADSKDSVIEYHALTLSSDMHESDDLLNFPGIYYDAAMTGIGIGIYIPAQRARWIEETQQYVLKFQYK